MHKDFIIKKISLSLSLSNTNTTMSKTFNTNFIKFVFVAVIFGFLFQLREIAAEYQCPSFGALLFFVVQDLCVNNVLEMFPTNGRNGFDWFSMNLSAGTA